MNELKLVRRGGSMYVDSREVATAIGKRHNDLLRDIRGYVKIMGKIGVRNFAHSDFFVEASYTSGQNREMPCYLLTKMGCELVASKLTGEKGVLFSCEYIRRFNDMELREHEREILTLKSQAVTPRLQIFNNAVRNVLAGLNSVRASGMEILDFLCGAYTPFGISVSRDVDNQCYTATEIAGILRVFSESGMPHGHAVSAIIEKLGVSTVHTTIVPYGTVGVTTYYDDFVCNAVWDWLSENDFPHDIPHNGIFYHVRICDKNGDKFTENELSGICADYYRCHECPGLYSCPNSI